VIEPHGVTITLEKIYEKLVELEVRLGDHPKQVDDHERRIRSLEVKVWGVSGIFAAIGIMVAQIMNGGTV
jgi:nitrogenase molybdenum-iron protein alpha/beta subunit